MRRAVAMLVPLLAVAMLAGCGGGGSKSTAKGPPRELLTPAKLTAKAPQIFKVAFHTTKGDFVVTVHRAWAAHGADRVYNLVKAHFFDGVEFFRVVPNFVVQFGISPYPAVSKAWENATIPDDRVAAHNGRGAVSFAAGGPNSRTTQIFINLADNLSLDSSGFAPVGEVTSGMKIVDALYNGYGDDPTAQQAEMQTQGNAWLDKNYPKLDSITSATIPR
jgi:peptidyl-prolyl cis-trans isomerase A (cyclophilin A)